MLLACRDPDCTQNYVSYFKDCKGYHANIVMTHYKNSSSKGKQVIEVSDHLIEPLILLQKAHDAFAPDCPTLFFSKSFTKLENNYFSIIVGDALTVPGHMGRCSATTFRSLYMTEQRKYLHSLGTKLIDVARDEIDKAAAQSMLSSQNAVNKYYDMGDAGRAFDLIVPY